MPHLLVALDGGPDIPTGREPIVVGRHPHCDVCLRSTRVSRRHFCKTEGDGAVPVRDLGSTNGIRIIGRRKEWGWLHPGDVLAIVHLRYRVEEVRAAASGADRPSAPDEVRVALGDPPGTALYDER
jgi:pSer/pThr/pTyr-binding forkhead associated (FHA) protein